MVEDMRFTEEEVIRMNITLGITGDMFKEHSVFYTDFLAMANNEDKNKRRRKTKKTVNLDTSSGEESHPEDRETVDPTILIANSMKPQYLKRAIQKDKKVKGFNPDIDNFPGVRNIENFIIAALIDETDDHQTVTKGIIQIFNKDRTRVLSPQLTTRDIRRIEGIQKLLGAAITRAEIYSTCLTTLLGLGLFLDNSKIIGVKTNIIDDEFIHSLYDIANMVTPLD
jgi:hypothetical protein